MMYKIIDALLNIGCLAAAVLYLLTIIWAQLNCSLIPAVGRHCGGPELDAWMVPFFLAPIGVPAIIGVVLMVWGSHRR